METDELICVAEDESLRLRQFIEMSPALLRTALPDGYVDFFNLSYAGCARTVIAKCSLLGCLQISTEIGGDEHERHRCQNN
jgi:hypothetical protein